MRQAKTPNVVAYFFNVVMDFRDVERATATRLPVHEREKVRDLQDDVRFYGPRLEKDTPLGCAFARFESFAGYAWPYWFTHPLRWARQKFLHERRTGRKNIVCHTQPPGPDHSTIAFVDDFFLFDRLSLIYGGKFRGSIVVNYTLGVIASGILVFSLTMGSAWQPDGTYGLLQYLPIGASMIELMCLVAIG